MYIQIKSAFNDFTFTWWARNMAPGVGYSTASWPSDKGGFLSYWTGNIGESPAEQMLW